MEFRKWDIEFDGGYRNPAELKSEPGIWVIWRRHGLCWSVVDIGEADDVRAATVSHPVRSAPKDRPGIIYYTATYTGVDPGARSRLLDSLRGKALPLLVT